MSNLLSHHMDDLRRSGLSDETIKTLRFCSADAFEVNSILGFNAGAGLVIPYPDNDGDKQFSRVKPDNPPVIKGKPAKYLSPKGAIMRAYLPPKTREALKDPKQSVIITEGEKKAAKADQEGFPCIGLGGVYAFYQNHQLIPDLNNIVWKGRLVVIAFDSDVVEKEAVKDATFVLERELVSRGAAVNVVRFKKSVDGLKVGLDDFLVSQGNDSLRQLLKEVKPALMWEVDDVAAMPSESRLYPMRKLFSKFAQLDPVEIHPYRELCLTNFGIQRRDFQSQFTRAIAELKSRNDGAKAESEVIRGDLTTPVAEEIKESAMKLLVHPALLYQEGQMVHRLGVAGEDKNIRIIYLAVTSRITKKPISITQKGDSSSGKSYTVTKVLDPFPDSAYILMTAMSKQALFYMADTESFSHRTVIIFEKPGADEADYTIRTLQSEDKLIFWVPQKDPRTERWVTSKIEKEGPTNFIITTTSPELHAENETRNWSLVMDESPQVTMGSKVQSALRYQEVPHVFEEELLVWRQIQNELKPVRVYIPYAKWLAEHTPNKPIRVRRDFNKLLSLIEIITLLHQYQRKRRGEVVEASLEDYFMARELADEVFTASLSGINMKVKSLVAEVEKQWTKNLESGNTVEGIKPVKIAAALGISRSTVSRWLEPAVTSGMVDVVSERANGSARLVKPGKAINAVEFLPTIEQLAEAFPMFAKDFHAVHPITGEEVALFSDEPEIENEKCQVGLEQ